MRSKVYFAQVKEKNLSSRNSALNKLLENINTILEFKKDEIVPIKMTVGEASCIYQIDPSMAKTIVKLLKEKKTRPFLFDTNVIYKGNRMNAVDHLNLVQTKGFGFSQIGAPFIVADGLFGQDGKEFVLDSGHIKKIKTPSFVGLLENLLVVSHVTGHMLSGLAASIKNVAMGMSCRPTKQVQHSALKPHVIKDECVACGYCIQNCPVSAISFLDNKAFIDQKICIGCGECLCVCQFDAIYLNWEEDVSIFVKRLVDTASFILSQFKNKFFINFGFDISQDCDCISDKNNPILCPDLGIFASNDILALDKATYDFMASSTQSSFLENNKKQILEMFGHAYKKGLGNLDYELIRL